MVLILCCCLSYHDVGLSFVLHLAGLNFVSLFATKILMIVGLTLLKLHLI